MLLSSGFTGGRYGLIEGATKFRLLGLTGGGSCRYFLFSDCYCFFSSYLRPASSSVLAPGSSSVLAPGSSSVIVSACRSFRSSFTLCLQSWLCFVVEAVLCLNEDYELVFFES